MPELPEVETIRRGLERELIGRRFDTVQAARVRLRAPSPMPLADLAGKTVMSTRRHGKFLDLGLTDDAHLVVHLGMTGKLLFGASDDDLAPHTHLRLGLDDGRELRYIDPRRFGSLKLYGPGDPVTDTLHYGPDALDPAFSVDHLRTTLARSRAPLKSFLLDQTKVAGVGNIYACEALWRVGLSPRRKACNAPSSKVDPLREAIVATLLEAVAQGGTSFNDYVNEIGQPGTFIANLAVFQREGVPCPRCGTEIRRIVQANRSTFFCPGCQR